MSFFHLKVIVIIFSHFHIFQCSWSYFTRAELNLLFCEYIKIFKNSFFREDCICGIVILLQAHKVSCTRVDILLCLKRIYMASCTSHIFVRKWVMILYLYESNSPFCFFGAFITSVAKWFFHSVLFIGLQQSLQPVAILIWNQCVVMIPFFPLKLKEQNVMNFQQWK